MRTPNQDMRTPAQFKGAVRAAQLGLRSIKQTTKQSIKEDIINYNDETVLAEHKDWVAEKYSDTWKTPLNDDDTNISYLQRLIKQDEIKNHHTHMFLNMAQEGNLEIGCFRSILHDSIIFQQASAEKDAYTPIFKYSPKLKNIMLYSKNSHGENPLHLAIRVRAIEWAIWLMKESPDLIQDKTNKTTSFHLELSKENLLSSHYTKIIKAIDNQERIFCKNAMSAPRYLIWHWSSWYQSCMNDEAKMTCYDQFKQLFFCMQQTDNINDSEIASELKRLLKTPYKDDYEYLLQKLKIDGIELTTKKPVKSRKRSIIHVIESSQSNLPLKKRKPVPSGALYCHPKKDHSPCYRLQEEKRPDSPIASTSGTSYTQLSPIQKSPQMRLK
ncbi:MAG TPA: ankyrin repeat domain-containing protein [Gammaproteobacteria bacterium]|nr:ankyrin repeat domain-containing protein [Gammaproteobacteria bacterium]